MAGNASGAISAAGFFYDEETEEPRSPIGSSSSLWPTTGCLRSPFAITKRQSKRSRCWGFRRGQRTTSIG